VEKADSPEVTPEVERVFQLKVTKHVILRKIVASTLLKEERNKELNISKL
jgi:hypothetical protein